MFKQIYEKFKYLCRLIFKKNKPMRCFKSNTIHYGRNADMYIAFDYDRTTNMTYFEQKIIGATKVFGSANEFQGDMTGRYEKEYVGKPGFVEVPISEFNKYNIGKNL